ncbi:ABC transporter permease [Lachnoclostridium phytofermentans]|uniref:ABC transporter permease n=1 Tax=Lachnoclostridium phytofermentans TaxID=66219 RepID=UPI000495399A|nr:ABC transporter permease subunit [Lachnoclostridium phytofermentans]
MKRNKNNAIPTRVKSSRLKMIKKSMYLYIIFVIPFIYFILFHYLPMYGVIVSFQDYNIVKGFSGSEWVGFKHFEKFLTDSYFWKLVRNTLLLNIYGLLWGFPIPIILALLLNELKNGVFKRVVQSVSYLPHFISSVVVCGMVTNFLASDGLINKILNYFGHDSVQFLMFPEYFRTIFTTTGIWQSAGWNSIIYLSALTAVDQEVVEAAMIDGAGRLKRIRHVMLPSIAPTVSVMLIMQIGKLMNLGYEKILLLYNGSTYETADVISTYVYRRGIINNDLSYATAVGLFQSIIGLILLISANKISKKVSETSMW